MPYTVYPYSTVVQYSCNRYAKICTLDGGIWSLSMIHITVYNTSAYRKAVKPAVLWQLWQPALQVILAQQGVCVQVILAHLSI